MKSATVRTPLARFQVVAKMLRVGAKVRSGQKRIRISYTVAKTLAQELTKTIERLEGASGRQIMTAMETAAFLTKTTETPNEN